MEYQDISSHGRAAIPVEKIEIQYHKSFIKLIYGKCFRRFFNVFFLNNESMGANDPLGVATLGMVGRIYVGDH